MKGEKMKKLLLALVLVFALAVPVMAEEVPFQWLGTDLKWEADGHFFLNHELKNSWGVGLAAEFAQLFDNMAGARLEIATSNSNNEGAPDRLAGIGVIAKFNNIINKIGGKTLIPEKVQIGASVLFDFTHGLNTNIFRKPYTSLLVVGISF